MRLRTALVGTTALGAVGLGLVVPTAPAYAADNACLAVEQTTPGTDTSRPSAPLAMLGVEAAQQHVARFGSSSGTPVRVAVVSSGVRFGDAGVIPLWSLKDLSGVGGDKIGRASCRERV